MAYGQGLDGLPMLPPMPGMVGTIGGEPLLHPEFEKFARYLERQIPDKKRRGLWSTIPEQFSARYGELIKDVYGNLYLNDHTIDAILHQPVHGRNGSCKTRPAARQVARGAASPSPSK